MTTNAAPFEPLISVAEAAKLLALHPKSVSRMCREGRIRGAMKLGKSYRLRASVLSEWIDEQMRTSVNSGSQSDPVTGRS